MVLLLTPMQTVSDGYNIYKQHFCSGGAAYAEGTQYSIQHQPTAYFVGEHESMTATCPMCSAMAKVQDTNRRLAELLEAHGELSVTVGRIMAVFGADIEAAELTARESTEVEQGLTHDPDAAKD